MPRKAFPYLSKHRHLQGKPFDPPRERRTIPCAAREGHALRRAFPFSSLSHERLSFLQLSTMRGFLFSRKGNAHDGKGITHATAPPGPAKRKGRPAAPGRPLRGPRRL